MKNTAITVKAIREAENLRHDVTPQTVDFKYWGTTLQRMREEQGLTREKLIEKIKENTGATISHATLQRIEGGREPKISELFNIIVTLEPNKEMWTRLFLAAPLQSISNQDEVIERCRIRTQRESVIAAVDSGVLDDSLAALQKTIGDLYLQSIDVESLPVFSFMSPLNKQFADIVGEVLQPADSVAAVFSSPPALDAVRAVTHDAQQALHSLGVTPEEIKLVEDMGIPEKYGEDIAFSDALKLAQEEQARRESNNG